MLQELFEVPRRSAKRAIFGIVSIVTLLAAGSKICVIVIFCVMVQVHNCEDYFKDSDTGSFAPLLKKKISFNKLTGCITISNCTIWQAAKFAFITITF